MNADQTSRNDDRRFDLLVDGELSPSEFRSLLASLDEEPALWRRCALAFLEAQALGRDLAAASSAAPRHALTVVKSTPPARVSAAAWRWPLALAASFVVAFSLGIAAGDWFAAPTDAQIIVNRLPPQTPPEPSLAQPTSTAPEITLTSHPQPIGNVQVEFTGNNQSSAESMELPVYDYEGVAEQWLTAYEPALSDQVVEALRSRGHEVRYEQKLIPFALDDGRQLVFPVEQYQITPVSLKAY